MPSLSHYPVSEDLQVSVREAGQGVTAPADGPTVVYSHHAGTHDWYRSTDPKIMLSRDLSDLVFVDRDEDPMVAFQARFPATHPLLSRVHLQRNAVYYQVYDESVYFDGKLAELLALTQELGEVFFCGLAYNQSDFWNQGCYIRMPSSDYDVESGQRSRMFATAVYNPKIAARQQAAEARREARLTQRRERPHKPKWVRVDDVTYLLAAMWEHLHQYLPGLPVSWGGDRACVLKKFYSYLTLFGIFYGPAAVRQLPAWRALMQLWRETEEKSCEAFKEDADFCEMMEAECRRRKPRTAALKLRVRLSRIAGRWPEEEAEDERDD